MAYCRNARPTLLGGFDVAAVHGERPDTVGSEARSAVSVGDPCVDRISGLSRFGSCHESQPFRVAACAIERESEIFRQGRMGLERAP